MIPWTAARQASLSFTISQSWICSSSCPLSQWCHPTVSSSVAPFTSCPQSFPPSGSLPMSQIFTSGGQSIRASASGPSVNIQGWFPLGLTGLLSLLSKGLSRLFSSTTVRKHHPVKQRQLIITVKIYKCNSGAKLTIHAGHVPPQRNLRFKVKPHPTYTSWKQVGLWAQKCLQSPHHGQQCELMAGRVGWIHGFLFVCLFVCGGGDGVRKWHLLVSSRYSPKDI